MTEVHHQPPPTPPAPAGRPADEGEGSSPLRLGILAAVIGFLGLQGGWPLLVVILGVVVMIFLHELGHYLAAKAGGMKVTEFFIGFGPKIWSFQRGETEYGFKAIPAGAYVKIVGMNNLDEVEPGEEHLAYRSKSYPKRMLVAVAGSAMHFAQALVLLFLLYAFVGVPGGSLTQPDLEWRVDQVVADSAAGDAGLRSEDRVVALDGESVGAFSDFAADIASMPGEDVVLSIVRDGDRLDVPVTIGRADEDRTVGRLGISRERVTTTVGPVAAVGRSVSDFGDQTTATLGFIGDFFSFSGIRDFAGDVADGGNRSNPVVEGSAPTGTPQGEVSSDDGNRIISIVGAVQIGANLTEAGLLGFLLFFVGINITIGIFNLLPVLPLDGGHVVVATYERIREFFLPRGERYHVDFARLLPVVYAVFLLLVMLGVTTIYLDLVDPVEL